MSSAGHVLDMIARIKFNEALKKGKREQRRKLNELFQKEGLHVGNNAIRESDISQEDMERVKQNIHNTSLRERKSGFVYSLIISTLIILEIIAIVYWGFMV